jgi:APA family basic amino acid/polyamine antiporter
MVIYLLVNLALLYVLPLQQLATSNLPAADAAQAIFGARSGQLITALSLLSLLGTINIVIMEVPRILFGLSRDGLFSSKASWVNRGGTPVVALLLSTGVQVLLVVSGSFARTLGIALFLFVAIYTLGFACLFVLRMREPELSRPFRAWGYPWTTLIVFIGSLGFLIGAVFSDTLNSTYALLLIAISYPVYLLTKKLRHRSL